MTIVLKQNSPEIRQKIEDAGIELCICTKFKDACWLDYHPGITKSVHGVGYYGEDSFTNSQQEELDRFVQEATDPVWCKDVDEFIDKIKEAEKERMNYR